MAFSVNISSPRVRHYIVLSPSVSRHIVCVYTVLRSSLCHVLFWQSSDWCALNQTAQLHLWHACRRMAACMQICSQRLWPSTQNSRSLLGPYQQSYVSNPSQPGSLDIPVQYCDCFQQASDVWTTLESGTTLAWNIRLMHEAAWDHQSEATLALCVYVYALMNSSTSAKQIQAFNGQWPMQINTLLSGVMVRYVGSCNACDAFWRIKQNTMWHKYHDLLQVCAWNACVAKFHVTFTKGHGTQWVLVRYYSPVDTSGQFTQV